MTANGIAQIVLYLVVLTLLAYPLGAYMARVYAGHASPAALARRRPSAASTASSARAPTGAGLEGYANTALVFMGVFALLLYLLLRLQGTCR